MGQQKQPLKRKEDLCTRNTYHILYNAMFKNMSASGYVSPVSMHVNFNTKHFEVSKGLINYACRNKGEDALLFWCDFYANMSNSDMMKHNKVVRMVIS